MKNLISVLACSVFLPSLALAGPVSGAAETSTAQDSPEAVRAVIEAANAEINRLLRMGEFNAAGMYFAEDVIQLISGQPPIGSRAEWIATQQGAAQMGEWDLQLEVLDLEVRGDIAVERGRGTQTFTANEESPMPSFQVVGDYMVMWKKADDRWQIQWDYVVIQPPAEQ